MPAEARFPAMGTSVHVVVHGDRALCDLAATRIADLERRWSRFLPDSEISRINRLDGAPAVISDETWLLLHHSVRAWTATRGLFDPSVLGAMNALGYDRPRTWSARPGASQRRRHTLPREPRPSRSASATGQTIVPGLGDVELDRLTRTVRMPPDVGFDPGGIAKGLAADIVATGLVRAGADAALVNVGGDLRVSGTAPRGRWSIGIEEPRDRKNDLCRIAISRGGAASSSRLERRWRHRGEHVHHLLDPRTGVPASSDAVAVTVFAGEAWWAEALTKPLMVLGSEAGIAMIESLRGASAVVVDAAGGMHSTSDLAHEEAGA